MTCCTVEAVNRQHLLGWNLEFAQIGHDEEGVEEEVIGSFLYHQDHTARGVPGVGLVLHVMAPLPEIAGRPASWALEIRRGQALQRGVALDTPQEFDLFSLQGTQGRIPGKAGIEADPDLLAARGGQAPGEMRNPGGRPIGGAGLARPQQAPHHVAGFGNGRDQRRIDPGTNMAMIGRSPLMSEDLVDGQAINFQGQPLTRLPARFLQMPARQAHQGLKVTAEGIEDWETLQALAEMGCDTAQGYVIARPIPATELYPLMGRRHFSSLQID